ncbi:MAG: hypothetical protein HYY76_13250 [Acidobacteria bacterium]|nr:hypothetical protein [Acidobacteriota bacterium]
MPSWRHAAAALVADLTHIFAGRLRSVVAYGPRLDGVEDAPLTCFALVESFGMSDLEACARLSPHWERQRVATPLVLPEQEFRRSLDAFPLEYGEIIRAHERLFGPDPFEQTTIAGEDLRRAGETQIKSHLLHLREGYIESAGRPQAVADLVATSAPAFAALLRNVARLGGATTSDRIAATLEGARAAGLPGGIVNDLLALERRPAVPTTDAARLFPDYLAAVEQLARTVDGWRTD